MKTCDNGFMVKKVKTQTEPQHGIFLTFSLGCQRGTEELAATGRIGDAGWFTLPSNTNVAIIVSGPLTGVKVVF